MDVIRIDSKNTKMVAHRGLSGLERENTCPAFVAAGNRSYYGVETDVHVTKDGRFVIIHDETTERVSGGVHNFNVEECAYAELKDLTLPDMDGSWNRADIRIPLLVDYIKICQKYEKVCVLELKNEFIPEDITRIVEAIRETGYLDKVTFISFAWNNCTGVRALLPDNDVQFLTSEEVTDELIDELVKNKLNLDVYFRRVSAELVQKLHDKGVLINCWTVDGKEDAEKLVEMGVDFITSNILE